MRTANHTPLRIAFIMAALVALAGTWWFLHRHGATPSANPSVAQTKSVTISARKFDTHYFDAAGKQIFLTNFNTPFTIQGPPRYLDANGREISETQFLHANDANPGPGQLGVSLIDKAN
jgi:hypothetical protein